MRSCQITAHHLAFVARAPSHGRVAAATSAPARGTAVRGPDTAAMWTVPEQTIALNRRARHEFSIDDTFEAGIVLTGTEIKSIRAGKVNLADAYARIERGEAWLIGAHIAPYEQAQPLQPRAQARRGSCCSTASEIDELLGRTQGEGPDDGPAAAVHQRPRPGQGRARARPAASSSTTAGATSPIATPGATSPASSPTRSAAAEPTCR